VISVAGAVDHDEALSLVEEELPAQPAAPPISAPLPAEPAPANGGVSVLFKKTEQANIVVGARSVSHTDPDRFAVDVLNGILGDGMSSRLFSELRERQALAYDVHSFTIRLSDSGALAIYIGCDPQRAQEAVRAAVGELQRLATELVGRAELGRAVEYLKGRLVLGLESSASMSSYLGQQELATGSIMAPAEVMERVDAVTPDDVRRMASATLTGGLRAAVVGPFRAQNGFDAALKGE
jgi:predicted Zn-dependent peptidase